MGSRFQWSEVDRAVVTTLLSEYSSGKFDEASLVGLSGEDLAECARRRLGSPIKPAVFSQVSRPLLTAWLPLAGAGRLEEMSTVVQKGLNGDARCQPIGTQRQQIDFLLARNHTDLFKERMRGWFIAAHKVRDDGPPRPPVPRSSPKPVEMRGQGEPPPHGLYAHQLEAHRQLDALLEVGGRTAAGVVVLPTGSGKTETLVCWLLNRLVEEPNARVLWIAGQQELLIQAAERFTRWARVLPVDFARTGRAIYSGSYPISVLAAADLDVAFVTTKTLSQDVATKTRRVVDKFIKRPTYVVFDEAHHAGAPTHSAMLDHLRKRRVRTVIGLTATPFPTALVGRRRFREHFPTMIQPVTAHELMRQGILARPVLHTVRTNITVRLDEDELLRAESGDVSAEVLNRLDDPGRNRIIVEQYCQQRERWGKTLIFATSINNANELHGLLTDEGVSAGVIHSQMADSRGGVLGEFQATDGTDVLVSVGMLHEGIDVPGARTAFLARPTASRILLQQMIGRVLRGPAAGGDPIAHLVHFKDDWRNFNDVLEPPEVISWPTPAPGEDTDRGGSPDERDDISDWVVEGVPELGPAAVADLQRQIDNARSVSVAVASARLAGYYQLDDRQIPVFEHQLDGWCQLLDDAASGAIGKNTRMSYFDDTPSPLPVERSVKAALRCLEAWGEVPFHPLVAPGGVEEAADALLAAGPLDESARIGLLEPIHRRSIDRLRFPTFEHFEAAVQQELRDRRQQRVGPEEPPRSPEVRPRLALPRADRNLKALRGHVISRCREILPGELLERLDETIPVEWTKRPVTSYFAHWTLKTHGKDRGREKIKVNRLLRTTPEAVGDEVLGYLVFHELLHHMLPWNGHDPEFRRFEAMWPNATELDAELDTLADHWDLHPDRYVDA